MTCNRARKKRTDFDAAVAAVVDAALAMADGLMQCAPEGRPIHPDELKRVETFVLGTLAGRLREAWAEDGISPSAVALFGTALEGSIRASFSEKFYASAPLAQMRNEGRA